MRQVRIGVVGLGSIARKAWLPVLARASQWQLTGGFSRNQDSARPLCDSYRIPLYASLEALAADCDAIFVHTSTDSHAAVVGQLLKAGVDVLVDKPLAARLSDAERLVELADKHQRKLMVGFNRRFAPRYLQLRQQMKGAVALRMEKHRIDSVGPGDASFTLLDDYLHVVDTALWLAGDKGRLQHGTLLTNDSGEMIYAGHHFSVGGLQVATSMHRRAGTQRERIELITDGALFQVDDMRDWRCESQGLLRSEPAPGWQTLEELRGFAGAAQHFIRCVENQTMPQCAGEQALLAQRVVDRIWRELSEE
ncbi:virulence factor MviM [Erwinia sp. OLTSP20]|uniref:Gfo/Idh/MocA family protein n=1 Tax=unclassified Erwinia TaxID=2622719 RepID=UPI000C19BD8F|nr:MULTISPECIES: Gfo/Idh/MocA family oxidoreductase [unclassified Erwinia]PIJ51914.1 virulence factor MviM [Erwinia sp. OAMSP11]PIJ74789.1 virulence factor MviM [Erwinia sp. OLSSP12]PIJ85175.1 virulence factor MviM [Erwinia sp. OLCASP19]PIJ87176.1 virulence factor MviM [Erwinia sp. OLMTSP26]PIJ88320.1 virulence factor MviM [Erwinia sp. OLMDSP33]